MSDLNQPPAPADTRLTGLTIFMRGLAIEAEIGVYGHEHGRAQPLVIDVEATFVPDPITSLAQTLNYETLAEAARTLAARGHVELVETFAQELALACLADPRVSRVRVRVEKPQALPGAAAAGVEAVAERG